MQESKIDRPLAGSRRRSRLLRAGQLIAAFAVAAGTLATASTTVLAFGTPAACTGRTYTQLFSRWGDTAPYFAMPNAGFESGTTGWLLTGGATVVSGNESFNVVGGSHSLQIPAGATVESQTICVSRGEDTIRLFVKNSGVSSAILHVEASVQNPTTGQTAVTAFDVNGNAAPTGWAPTMRLQIPNLLGGDGTENLTIRISTRNTAATWAIDDVYVDPYKSW